MTSRNRPNPYPHCKICRHRMYKLIVPKGIFLICRNVNHPRIAINPRSKLKKAIYKIVPEKELERDV